MQSLPCHALGSFLGCLTFGLDLSVSSLRGLAFDVSFPLSEGHVDILKLWNGPLSVVRLSGAFIILSARSRLYSFIRQVLVVKIPE